MTLDAAAASTLSVPGLATSFALVEPARIRAGPATASRLIMGADSWTPIMAKLDALRTEYEKWKDVACRTYFS